MTWFARKVQIDGYTFDSAREAERYGELRLLEQQGKIAGLEVHPVFVLLPAVKLNGRTKKAATYTADFSYTDVERLIPLVIEDVKARPSRDRRTGKPRPHGTAVYRLHKHMMRALLGLDVTEVE